MAEKTVTVWVLDQSESGRAIECALCEGATPTFWLPKKSITPLGKVRRHCEATFTLPEWLWLSHRQLCGDQLFEAEKRRKGQRATPQNTLVP